MEGNARKNRKRLWVGAIVALTIGLATVLLVAPPVAADDFGNVGTTTLAMDYGSPQFFVPAVVFFGGLAAGFATAVVWKDLSMKKKAAATIVSVMLIGVGGFATATYVAANWGPGTTQVDCNLYPNDPRCVVPPGYTATWQMEVPGTIQGGGRDAASEVPAGGSWTACASITGQGTLTLDAYATNVQVDRSARSHTIDITVDDDVSTGTAAFQAPDCHSNDYTMKLGNPVDAAGDGSDDSISLWVRLKSWTGGTYMIDGNSSQQNSILYRDNSVGWYIWAMTEDADQTGVGEFYSFFPAGSPADRMPSSSGFVRVGSNTGSAIEYMALGWAARNYGWYGYTQPETAHTYTLTFEFCTPIAGACPTYDPNPNDAAYPTVEWTYTVRLLARA